MALAATPVEELLALLMLQPDRIKDPLHAYQTSKRGNSLRIMAEAARWYRKRYRCAASAPREQELLFALAHGGAAVLPEPADADSDDAVSLRSCVGQITGSGY